MKGDWFEHWEKVPPGFWRWPHFKPSEIASPDDGSLLIDAESLDKLEQVRWHLGKPMNLNSAYRTPAHNAAVGGEVNSQHLLGKAFDVRLAGFTRQALKAAARAAGFTGIGDYDSFVHIDTGPPRYWNRRTKS